MPISEALVGLTVMAWGNNIGDIMNSAVAAKRGNAQLSVSAVMATQILNLQISLGLPWLIGILIFGEIEIYDETTLDSLYFTLLITALSFMTLICNSLKLDIRSGFILTALYVFFVLIEFFVLGNYEI